MYIKHVLEFHELNDDANNALKIQEKSQRRGAAGVAYGKPAHILDASRYINEAWNAITQQTIKNAFIKADLKIWNQAEEEPSSDIVDHLNTGADKQNNYINLHIALVFRVGFYCLFHF